MSFDWLSAVHDIVIYEWAMTMNRTVHIEANIIRRTFLNCVYPFDICLYLKSQETLIISVNEVLL